jgi:hypothetical protein
MQIWSQDFNPLQKGNFLIGGSLSGFYEKTENLDFKYTYELDIHPNVGYFIFDRFAVGIAPTTSVQWSRNNVKNKFDQKTNLNISPTFRYYVWKNLFVSFEPGYLVGHFESGRVDSKTKGYSLNQGIGYDLFVKNGIAIELGYYYYYSKENVDAIYEEVFPFVTDLVTNRFKLNIGIQVTL